MLLIKKLWDLFIRKRNVVVITWWSIRWPCDWNLLFQWDAHLIDQLVHVGKCVRYTKTVYYWKNILCQSIGLNRGSLTNRLVLQETKSEPNFNFTNRLAKTTNRLAKLSVSKKTIDWPVTPIDWPRLKCDFQKINDVCWYTNVLPNISLHIQI
jgi:hypothetical protein